MVALGIFSVIYQERIVEREVPVIQEVPKIVNRLVRDVKEVPKNHAETPEVLAEHSAVTNNRVVSDVNGVSAGSMAAETAAPKVVQSADASTSEANADTNKDLPVVNPQTLEVPASAPAASKPSYVNRSVQTTEKPSYVNRSVQTTDQPVEIFANTEVNNLMPHVQHSDNVLQEAIPEAESSGKDCLPAADNCESDKAIDKPVDSAATVVVSSPAPEHQQMNTVERVVVNSDAKADVAGTTEQQLPNDVDVSEVPQLQEQPDDKLTQDEPSAVEETQEPSTEQSPHTEQLKEPLADLQSDPEDESDDDDNDNDNDEHPKELADGQPKRRAKGKGYGKRRALLLSEIDVALKKRPAKKQPAGVHAKWLWDARLLNQRIQWENERVSRMEKNPAGWTMIDLIDVSDHLEYKRLMHQIRPAIDQLEATIAQPSLHAKPLGPSRTMQTPYPLPHPHQPGQTYPLPFHGQLQPVQPYPMQPMEAPRGNLRSATRYGGVNGDRSRNGGPVAPATGTGLGSSMWSSRGRGRGRA